MNIIAHYAHSMCKLFFIIIQALGLGMGSCSQGPGLPAASTTQKFYEIVLNCYHVYYIQMHVQHIMFRTRDRSVSISQLRSWMMLLLKHNKATMNMFLTSFDDSFSRRSLAKELLASLLPKFSLLHQRPPQGYMYMLVIYMTIAIHSIPYIVIFTLVVV
jgi:hypothetical protein